MTKASINKKLDEKKYLTNRYYPCYNKNVERKTRQQIGGNKMEMGMTLFEVIKMVAREHGYNEQDIEEDQFLDDIEKEILDNCGDLSTVEEAIEQVEAFFE